MSTATEYDRAGRVTKTTVDGATITDKIITTNTYYANGRLKQTALRRDDVYPAASKAFVSIGWS